MASHTPGEWEVYPYGARFGIEAIEVSRDTNVSIVVFGGEDEESGGVCGRDPEEALANARIIAAAPKLLLALRTARDRLALMLRPDDPRNDDAFRLVDDTIKRVEGEDGKA